MSKFVTNNLKEYRDNPDLIYFDDKILKSLRVIKIVRCDNPYCRRILPSYKPSVVDNSNFTTYLKYEGKNYCDKYCRSDAGCLLKSYTKVHLCKNCKRNKVKPIRTKKPYPMITKNGTLYYKKVGTIINWRTICDECKKKKYKNKSTKIIKDNNE